jgi:shikimate dehydrogenase
LKATTGTQIVAFIGDPVAQGRSPALLTARLRQLGVDGICVPFHVPASRLIEVLEGLRAAANVMGMIATIPHKATCARLACSRSERVEVAGVANVLRPSPDGGWESDLYDGLGFVRGLERVAGFLPLGRHCHVVGAGGAGAAIATELLRACASAVSITDIDDARAEMLALRLAARWPGRVTVTSQVPREADLAVNATPLGMREDDPLPFDPFCVSESCLVAEVVMSPAETRLLRTARRAGRRAQPGAPMLDFQIDAILTFFGVRAAGVANED